MISKHSWLQYYYNATFHNWLNRYYTLYESNATVMDAAEQSEKYDFFFFNLFYFMIKNDYFRTRQRVVFQLQFIDRCLHVPYWLVKS